MVITAWPSHEVFDAWIATPDRDRLTASDTHRSVDYHPITRYDVAGGYLNLERAHQGAAMKWVTREHPKTDRIACPWLIKNFIDPDAEFLYVPADEVLAVAERESAHSYDAKGARYTHRDGLCSFEVLVEEYEISDPAVHLLARIVHGADVADDRDATPQSPGLQAVAEGFHYLVPDDDHRQLDAGVAGVRRAVSSGASARSGPSRPDPRRPPDHHRPGAARRSPTASAAS